jgi:hypothetical protein
MLLHQLGVSIWGGLLALLLFFLAVAPGLVKLEWVERTADPLLHYIALMLVPLTVGLMEPSDECSEDLDLSKVVSARLAKGLLKKARKQEPSLRTFAATTAVVAAADCSQHLIA